MLGFEPQNDKNGKWRNEKTMRNKGTITDPLGCQMVLMVNLVEAEIS